MMHYYLKEVTKVSLVTLKLEAVIITILSVASVTLAANVVHLDDNKNNNNNNTTLHDPVVNPLENISNYLENEIRENAKNSYNNKTDKSKRDLPKIQLTLLNILEPVPVVDTIKEEEKYGNTGDKFNRIGRGIVGGVETLSNLLNSALNFPLDAVKKVSRSATEALNNLGGKLVGLQ